MSISCALFFTLVRLVLSPLVLAPLIAMRASYNIVFPVYIVLVATDFFDGFCARRYNQVTPFGAFLDQFADKIFLFSVIFALVSTHQCLWWWALLIAIRELLVMGVREYGASHTIAMPVVASAKVKTALQMFFFGWLLLDYSSTMSWYITQLLGLMTIFFSYYSAYWYIKKLR